MHLSSEIAFNSWQQKWERDSSGFYTRFLLPQVRIPKSRFRMIVIPACPILQNVAQRYTAEWGQLQKRFKGISSVRLWWGTWNVSHFLLRCPHYDEIRNKLQNVLDDIWTAAKRKGHLHLVVVSGSGHGGHDCRLYQTILLLILRLTLYIVNSLLFITLY